MSDLNMSRERVSDLVYASMCELNFGNKLRNTNFKLNWNSLIFFNSGICCQIKICSSFFCLTLHIKLFKKTSK